MMLQKMLNDSMTLVAVMRSNYTNVRENDRDAVEMNCRKNKREGESSEKS